MNVGFVSLGCSKNLVVTEEVIGVFKKNGFDIVSGSRIFFRLHFIGVSGWEVLP